MRSASFSGVRSLRLLALVFAFACVQDLDARAQVLVSVDTDAHLVGELAARPEVSPAAAVDTLRVDILDAAGAAISARPTMFDSACGCFARKTPKSMMEY
jgi:hypothetical protein